MKRSQLKDYFFIDSQRLHSLVEQLPKLHQTARNFKWKIAVSLTGPSLEVAQDNVRKSFTNHKKIEKLIEYLESNDLISYKRPPYCYIQKTEGKPFILESMMATKVILPKLQIQKIAKLREFALWVSDPNQDELEAEPDTIGGTFVYLTEMHWDDDEYHSSFSGCSALRAIANTINGESGPRRYLPDPLGRERYAHPLTKLSELGALITDTRNIEALYRVRYMCDEQCVVINGRLHRTNDLLGYPIFIANKL